MHKRLLPVSYKVKRMHSFRLSVWDTGYSGRIRKIMDRYWTTCTLVATSACLTSVRRLWELLGDEALLTLSYYRFLLMPAEFILDLKRNAFFLHLFVKLANKTFLRLKRQDKMHGCHAVILARIAVHFCIYRKCSKL